MPDELDALRKRWRALCGRLGAPPPTRDAWLRAIEAKHGEPGRHYHTLRHLVELCAHVDAHASRVSDPDAVSLAIFFHDLVYDARGGQAAPGSNEDRSAAEFRRFAAAVMRAAPVAAAAAAPLTTARVDAIASWIEV
jgi:predicted metal-dependent HD superfamily phosphohydrolase